ncbi:MAG: putative glycolipid-binding domain-containing protein [Anaerolineae bacterium]|nr:putative glycolipid-binding domain-containing protein [Anaerolineae bacterium]
MTAHLRTILWNNRRQENMECCSLLQSDTGFQLQGSAVLKADQLPMRVSYRVDCDSAWMTRAVEIHAWRGDGEADLLLHVDQEQRWWQRDSELSEFRGLVDVDLGFTPATNTLPIQRLRLAEGDSAVTTTVWIQFPTLEIVRFPQRYTRIASDVYLFESLISDFHATLRIDDYGLVTDYETGWYQIASTD